MPQQCLPPVNLNCAGQLWKEGKKQKSLVSETFVFVCILACTAGLTQLWEDSVQLFLWSYTCGQAESNIYVHLSDLQSSFCPYSVMFNHEAFSFFLLDIHVHMFRTYRANLPLFQFPYWCFSFKSEPRDLLQAQIQSFRIDYFLAGSLFTAIL